MVRSIRVRAGHHRARRLRRPSSAAAAVRRAVAAAAPAAGRAGSSEAAIWHLRLRHCRHGQDRRARATISTGSPTALGPRTRRSRPTSRTTACSPSSTICRASARKTIIEEQAKDPEQQDRRRLRQLHGRGRGRGQGPRPDRAMAEPDPRRSSRRPALASALRRSRPLRHRHSVRRLRRPGRQGARPVYPATCSRPASACPTATIICRNDAEARRDRGRSISQHLTNDADAGRRDECRRARQGDPRLRDQDRQGAAGPASTAATRPRPTTR